MKIFAVTGTNGKTSTCAYLRQIFMRAGIKSASIGTLKSYIGRERFSLGAEDDNRMSTMTTPDPEQLYRILYEMENAGVENLVIEASSHAFKLDKLAPIRFESSVFTNFSAEHLDFHEDMSDYLMSKCRVFEMSDKVYINSDDSICSFAGRAFGNKVIGYGAYDPSASIRATNIINHGIDGISYKLRTDNGSFDIRCRIPGGFTLYNSMAAASVAIGQGIDSAVIGEAISTLDGIDGRMERVGGYSGNNDIAVFIDYAHTERAMDSLLSSVLPFKRGGHRIVTLFGCGGERDREKRAPMGRVASVYSDLVIITEDNSRAEEPDQIIEDIMRGIDKTKPHKIIKNRRKAIEYAIKTAIPGDIILLVGKGHEEYELTSRGKAPFSERKIVLDCLARRTEE